MILLATNSSAFATDIKASVTIKPSLSLNIPTNTIIMNLDPSTHTFDEKDLTIKVGTNNMYGYKLFVNTVNGTSDTNLVNIADNTKTIPNLSTSTTVSDFPVNQWGYRFTPNATSSSGNYGVFTPSDATPIMESTEPVNEDTATMGFAAKIDYTKPSGQYELNLDFKALPIVTTNYMQDIASDPTLANTICTEEPTVVIDKRDEQAYTIRRINGTCWMVENLQFTGTTMDSTTSNVAPEYTPQNPYRVNNGNGYEDLTSGNSYDESRIHVGNITTTRNPIDDATTSTTISTVWYNYAAATAGTITGNPNSDPQLYDICPKGWKLPNSVEVNSAMSYIDIYNPVSGGYYTNANKIASELARWWGAMVNNIYDRKWLGYNQSTNILSEGGYNRGVGNYIRCVLKDTNVNNLTYMQDFAKLNESGNTAKKQQVFNSMEQEQSYQLTDIRENEANSYYVSKLKDGKVWMIQNLRLGNNSSSVALTSADSNISASSWTLDGKVASPGKFAYTACAVGTCEDRYTNSATYYNDNNAYYCAPDSTSSNYYVGCYYDWYSATASSGTSSVTPVGTGVGYKDVSSSICPAGWYLPSGGGVPLSGSTNDRPDSDFNVLYNNYSSASAMLVANPTACSSTDSRGCDNASGLSKPGVLLGGLYNANGAVRVAESGFYWSRSAYSKGLAYRLYLNNSAVYPQSYDGKDGGLSVRCVTYDS